MNTKIKEWGNSLGVRLPKQAIVESGFNVEDETDVIARKGEIILKRHRVDYLKKFTPCISTKGWKFNREEANARH